MLVSFTFSNVKSFKKMSEFSMVSHSRIRNSKDHELKDGRLAILKNAGLYGSNAAGKTNFVNAISICKKFITTGVIDANSIGFKGNKKESTFSFVIKIQSALYQYRFSLMKTGFISTVKIIDEEINILKNDGTIKEQIYSRSKCYFNSNNSVLRVFEKSHRNASGILFLTYMSSREKRFENDGISRVLSNLFDFFLKDLIIINSFSNQYSIINERNIETIVKYLKDYDTGIENATFSPADSTELKNFIPDAILQNFVGTLERDPKAKRASIASEQDLYLLIKDNTGDLETKKLTVNHKNIEEAFSFGEESHGTKRLLYLIGMLLGGKSENKVFIIDEIERGCHPLLVSKLIEDFQKNNTNSTNQLIFTSHMSSLMDKKLRRDEIYFIEKDNFGMSSIYSLLEYKNRTKNLSERYLEGRFGAVPNLGVTLNAANN